jgi:folate-binding protein YgfZ
VSDELLSVRLERDVIAVTGPEAASYLQGQLSQDIAPLDPGASTWSWLLAPNGKVDALLRVTRRSADEWLLDTDAGWGELTSSRLARFKLRTKVEFSASELQVVGLRGRGWAPVADRSGAVAVMSPSWPGEEGADLLGGDLQLDGVAELDPAGSEVARILAGRPRMGAELDERTIPGETGLVPFTVSFTKGCYTGQELVARIDSRGGNVARRLRRLRLSGPVDAGSSPGAAEARRADLVIADGSPAGVVTSAAGSPDQGWVGLGYVRRGVDATAVLEVAGSGVEAHQMELPF